MRSRSSIAIRTPCPVAKCTKDFQGLLFGYSTPTPSRVKVVTLIPHKENAVNKHFPIFEAILGTAHPIHECVVHVQTPDRVVVILIAYQESPGSFPNQSLSHLVPNAEIYGEILAVRSGEVVLVQNMAGYSGFEAAKEAVRLFAAEVVAHRMQHRGKRRVPPLPTLLEG